MTSEKMVRDRTPRGFRPRPGVTRVPRTNLAPCEVDVWFYLVILSTCVQLGLEMIENQINCIGSADPFFLAFKSWLESLYRLSDILEEFQERCYMHLTYLVAH